jgi:hypothetical protein
MASKTKNSSKKIRCPYYPKECKEKYHPPRTQFCPNTGNPISLEPIENEELKRKVWFHTKINIFLAVILVVILALVIVFTKNNSKDNISTGGKEKPIEPIPDYLRSGGVTLKYQVDSQYSQLVPEMAEAYLKQFGASGIKRKENGKQVITVKGVIPAKNKQLNAAIRLQVLEKNASAAKTPENHAEEKIKRLSKQLEVITKEKEDIKEEKEAVQTQLTEEEIKRIDAEEQFEKVKNDKVKIQSQLTGEQAKRKKVEAQFKTEKSRRKVEERGRKEIGKKCYKSYITLVQKYCDSAEWQKALEYINKAKELNNTREADILSSKIQSVMTGNEKTVGLSALPTEIRKNYLKETAIISIRGIPPGITINEQRDQITLTLIINEKGNVKINEMMANNLQVEPGRQKRNLEQKIREHIEGMSLPPPRNKAGYPVKVKTWRFPFKVNIFSRKLILLRRD